MYSVLELWISDDLREQAVSAIPGLYLLEAQRKRS
jgi:hypothetical protein